MSKKNKKGTIVKVTGKPVPKGTKTIDSTPIGVGVEFKLDPNKFNKS